MRYGIKGTVKNTTQGVVVLAEGTKRKLDLFKRAVQLEAPPLAQIEGISEKHARPAGAKGFSIRKSARARQKLALISPDIATCPDCLRELRDERDRRHGYPFINCTNCGPRFTIIRDIPYDRANTTMAGFKMCAGCHHEYEDIGDRRYHAQPDACAECGPAAMLVKTGASGRKLGQVVEGNDVFEEAARLLKRGQVLAVKGLGGYHLACDAASDGAVSRLKRRKGREDKPLALMSPSLREVGRYAKLGKAERELLLSPRRPIVLLQKKSPRPVPRARCPISKHVAPDNNYLGVMLPYTPLHELLLAHAAAKDVAALVMTSGNSSDEPLTSDDKQAYLRLGGIADAYLVHSRPIHSRCDDSVLRMIGGQASFMRRARGYVPAPLKLAAMRRGKTPALGCGAELKTTFALLRDDYAVIGPHIGDLKNAETMDYYRESLALFKRMFRVKPRLVACDLHPDYLSSRYANELAGGREVKVQHHHAHIAACLAENRARDAVVGVAMDGTGYGTDGNIWGGEVLLVDGERFERLAHFDYVPMPGGDAAALENGRMAVSYLRQAFGEEMYDLPLGLWRWFSKQRARRLSEMIEARINSPLTSSCGRLFDAVAALLDLCRRGTYDGQAAVAVEMAAERGGMVRAYDYALSGERGITRIDYRPSLRALVGDLVKGQQTRERIAAGFHRTIIDAVTSVVIKAAKEYKVKRVAFSGGAFQNKLLAEGLAKASAARGLEVLQHRLLPPNDGSISLGQAMVARLVSRI